MEQLASRWRLAFGWWKPQRRLQRGSMRQLQQPLANLRSCLSPWWCSRSNEYCTSKYQLAQHICWLLLEYLKRREHGQ